jgi:hypothetical protein
MLPIISTTSEFVPVLAGILVAVLPSSRDLTLHKTSQGVA